jgi:tRNA(Ile)-lysidine synthase
VRNAVRAAIADLGPGDLVLAACSGGADSLALAAALAFVAPRMEMRAGGVTVDHGLQPGSADRAEEVDKSLAAFGMNTTLIEKVHVSGHGGPEAAAREARYTALEDAARRTGAKAVLLGHTLDDQAETVLLGLARGSGARSLSGMPPVRGIFRRPLLGVRRSVTRDACAALGLAPWDDPHNSDRRFARVRVRLDALPALERALGPGVAEALARTAGQLRADAEILENISAERLAGDCALTARELAVMPAAVRTRVLRAAAIEAGCPPGALTAGHVESVAGLVTDWHGQRWVDLPGGIRASRRDGLVLFAGMKTRIGESNGREGHGPGAQRGADHNRTARREDG